MSQLFYYCPECGNTYPLRRVERHHIKYHYVPKECFNCNNRFLGVLSREDIIGFDFKGEDCGND